MTQQVLIDPLQDEEVLQSTSSGSKQGGGTSYQLVDLDATKNKSNILKRTNFRQEERDVLVALITEYKSDVNCGRSKDSRYRWRYSHLNQTETWQLITDKFNSHPGFRQRDPAQLRKCWMNMKARSQFSMAQRKQLGLECSTVRPPSRSYKSRQSAAIRLRTPGTPNSISSRSFSNRKSNLSRVNASTQGKIKRSRQRMRQGEGYPQDVAQHGRYEVAKSAQGFSEFQLQSGGGNNDLQYLQETVQVGRGSTTNRQRQPQPMRLHLASGVMPQSNEIQRVTEMRTSPGYLMPDATTISSGNLSASHQMMTVAQSLNQSSTRSRPVAIQPATILSQMEQFTPPMPQRMMSNTVTVGEFLGKTVEMSPGSSRNAYNPRDDASGFDVSTANESTISFNTNSHVRTIESIADLERALETGGPVISNVTSINGESRSTAPSIGEQLDEIQIVIKTEDDADEVHEQSSSNSRSESVTRSGSADSRATRIESRVEHQHQITQTDGTRSRNISPAKNKVTTKNVAVNAQTQTEAVTGRTSDNDKYPGKEKQRESSGRSKTQSTDTVGLIDRIKALRNQSSDVTTETGVHYVDDDDVMEGESNDVRFVAAENADPEEQGEATDDFDDLHDQTENPSNSFNLDRHPNEDEKERKARVDLLFFEVEKAKEEAGAAKCRRELLEVEVETARQQMELTRMKQEMEIELIREKVRQEKAKADSMVVQTTKTCLSEPIDGKEPYGEKKAKADDMT